MISDQIIIRDIMVVLEEYTQFFTYNRRAGETKEKHAS